MNEKRSSIPDEIIDIVSDFGQVMADLLVDNNGFAFKSLSKLPYPKEKIKEALITCLKFPSDKQYRKALVDGLAFLETYVPDGRIIDDKDKNILAGAMLYKLKLLIYGKEYKIPEFEKQFDEAESIMENELKDLIEKEISNCQHEGETGKYCAKCGKKI